MLKKPAILLLMIVYFCTASGFSLNLHYCFGRLASIRIDAPANGCVTSQHTKKMKCCRDEHFVVKMQDLHQVASTLVLGKLFVFSLPPVSFPAMAENIQTIALAKPVYRGPPPFPDKPLYLKNQNFRI